MKTRARANENAAWPDKSHAHRRPFPPLGRPILYLNPWPGALSRTAALKVAGIRRHAKMLGHPVRVCVGDEVRPANLKRLLERIRPVGCIAESWEDSRILPPRLFGNVPVVHFDAPVDHPGWHGAASVSCDDGAVARAAFRELAADRPPSYAVVPYYKMRHWSDVRVAAFRELCTRKGADCEVFGVRKGEGLESRLSRLRQWVTALPHRCAIFAVNDDAAFQVMRAIVGAGRAVPRSVTLVGVDATEGYAKLNPDLPGVSSVEIDFELAGYLAAKMLAGMIGVSGPYGSGAATAIFGPLLVVRRKSTRGHGRREAWVMEAVELIRSKACEGLEPADLPAHFHISRRNFDRRFHEAMGHTVQDEIEHVRFERVFTLLRDPATPIGAIASFCGWHSDIALRWLFRRRMGMSMLDWRRRQT